MRDSVLVMLLSVIMFILLKCATIYAIIGGKIDGT